MLDELPTRIDPRRLGRECASFEGSVALERMARLVGATGFERGACHASVEIDATDRRRIMVRGTASATVNALCQRCLEPMPVDLRAPFELRVVDSEEDMTSSSQVAEIVLPPGEKLDLAATIEDELLLALPHITRHRAGQCQAPGHAPGHAPGQPPGQAPGASAPAPPRRENPFAALAALKSDSHQGAS